MSSDLVARVAVENTAYSFDKPFDYGVPESLAPDCMAGMRVLVPFGRGNKKRQGIVLEIFNPSIIKNNVSKQYITIIYNPSNLFFLLKNYFLLIYKMVLSRKNQNKIK